MGLSKESSCPGQSVRSLSCAPKCHGLSSQSGPMPRFGCDPWLERVQEATGQCICLALMFLSLSLSVSLSLSPPVKVCLSLSLKSIDTYPQLRITKKKVKHPPGNPLSFHVLSKPFYELELGG